MLTVLSSFAQEESKNVSDNINWRFKQKFQRGELVINEKRFLGYDKNQYGDLVINQSQAKVVKRIFEEYLSGKGSFTIAKELERESIPSAVGGTWSDTTILKVLKNEKYRGDVILQKYYTPNHLTKTKVKNNGQIDSYYIEDNHSPIITREMWEQVQEEIKRRAEAKGNVAGDTNKYTKRYQLTGMLYCSKCGATLRRRTWNSKHSCKKIVWQCSNYIRNGKSACEGTRIDDKTVSKFNIKEPVIIKEELENGTKRYSYTSKGKWNQSCTNIATTEKEDGSILQSFNRTTRAIIKL